MNEQLSNTASHDAISTPHPLDGRVIELEEQLAEAKKRIEILETRVGWIATPTERRANQKRAIIGVLYVYSFMIIGAIGAIIIGSRMKYNLFITFGLFFLCVAIPAIPIRHIVHYTTATQRRFVVSVVVMGVFFAMAVCLFLRFWRYGSSFGLL